MPRNEYLQGFQPQPLPNREPQQPVLPKQEQDADVVTSRLFDEVCTAANLTNAEIAYRLSMGGRTVSESLVRKMRSTTSRERVSFAQLFMLGTRFLWELHKAMHRHNQFQKQALADTVQALSLFAVGLE